MTPKAHDYTRDADSWLQWADHTYHGAQTLFHNGDFLLWFPAAILGHHALEMYLKAALIRKEHRIVKEDVWGHDLVDLLVDLARELGQRILDFHSDIIEKLQIFTDYFNELRYPDNLKTVEGLGEDKGYLLDSLVKFLRPYAMENPMKEREKSEG